MIIIKRLLLMALNQVQINYFFLKYQNNITIFITIRYRNVHAKSQKKKRTHEESASF